MKTQLHPGLGAALLVAVLLIPSGSTAAVTWYFNWVCPGCSKIGARTTGTEGPFASESACDSARSSMRNSYRRGEVDLLSCYSQGQSDSARPPARGADRDRAPGQENRFPEPSPAQDADADLRARERQAAERQRLGEERRKAAEEAERQFKRERDAAVGAMRGGAGELEFKSREPLFSKGTQSSAPVPLEMKDPAAKMPVVDPRTVKGDRFSQPRKSDRAGAAALLAALYAGRGDFDRADAFLKDLRALRPDDPMTLSIAHYVHAQRERAAAARPPFDPQPDDSWQLLEEVASRAPAGGKPPPPRTTRWPAPTRPANPKVMALLDAMDYGKGDWDRGLGYLDRLVRAHPDEKGFADARKTFADLMARERGR